MNEKIPAGLPEDPSITFNPTLTEDPSFLESFVTEDDPQNLQVSKWRVMTVMTESTGQSGDANPPLFSAQTDWAPQPVAYALKKVIARGGFGEIWEATQLSLNRTIAVKRLREDIIKEHVHDVEGLRRYELAFRQEALTAASLEHPNILPVHDLGLDEDGHLLLAMKMVRGIPWRDQIALDFHLPVADFLEKHLPILIDLTQAVAFAHSRGIVHRDLKPSQVLVGEFGEVLLVDWGIAMSYADKAPVEPLRGQIPHLMPTRENASNPAGTVAYMAPEQTERSPSNIGPWTDIYLLGGVLYEILTGKRPHNAPDRKAAFLQAVSGEVESPEIIADKRHVPRELADLAMEAMAREPALRIPTAEEFIRRLKDFLAGASKRREAMELIDSVKARLELSDIEYSDLGEMLTRLDRALVLWPANTEARRLQHDFLLRYSREALESRDLKLARIQAERLPETGERDRILSEIDRLELEQRRADERLAKAYEQAREQRDKAEEARKRAAQDHTRAERLVTFLLEDLHQGLQEVNRLDLLDKVSREALKYFETSTEDTPSEHSLHNRAISIRNIGDVFKGRGDLTEALKAYRSFHQCASAILEIDPRSPTGRIDLAESHDRIGTILYFQGRLDEAMKHHWQGYEILRELSQEKPGDPGIDGHFAHASHQVGAVHWRRQDLKKAEEYQRRSLEIYERLLERFPGRREFEIALGWNLGTFGNVLRDQGRLDEAISVTRQSVEIRERIHSQEPENMARLDDLCWSSTNLALLKEYAGYFEEALKTYRRALELRRRLAEGDPANAQHRNTMTFVLSSMGRVLYGLEQYEEAEKVCSEACKISSQLVERDPTNVREIGSNALNQSYYGQVLFALGRIDEADAICEKNIPAAEFAVEKVPTNGVFQNALAQSLLLQGLIREAQGSEREANLLWERCLAIIDSSWEEPATGQGQGLLAEVLLYLGRVGEAREAFQVMRENNWMMPRYETLLRERAGES